MMPTFRQLLRNVASLKSIAIATHLFIALLFTLSLATITTAAADNKHIFKNAVQTGSVLDFTFLPTSSEFYPGQPITFNMRANKNVFLYLYAQNPDGSTTLILPNYIQSQNHYYANQLATVPSADFQFIADGLSNMETIFAVATTQYIDLNIPGQRNTSIYPTFHDDTLQGKFSHKGIYVSSVYNPTIQHQHSLVPQSAVQQVNLNIRNVKARLTAADFGLPIPLGNTSYPTRENGQRSVHPPTRHRGTYVDNTPLTPTYPQRSTTSDSQRTAVVGRLLTYKK